MLVQSPIVPHEELESGVKGTHKIRAPYPSLVGNKAVPSMRITCCYNEDIIRNGLYYEERDENV